MPNFNFKSQFPIADVIAAAQKKPQIEAEIANQQEQMRQARFKTLLDALSTGAQAARLVSQNKNDAIARQQTQSQMTGQQDLQSILTEPPPQAPVAAPIQQFVRPMGPPTADGMAPAPVPSGKVAQPTFAQTPDALSQPQRLQAALLKGFPDAAGAKFAEQQFADPLDRAYKAAQINNVGVDNQVAWAKFLEEQKKNANAAAVEQSKLDNDRQKLAIEREKLKMEALNNGVKLSDVQANGLLFGERAAQAHQQLDALMSPSIGPDGKPVQGYDATKLSAGAGRLLPNFMQTEDAQKFQQSKLNFISAVLRKESGAAISNSEIKNAEKQYFPSAGDTPGVLLQKKANREAAIQGLFRAGGKQGEELLQKYRSSSGNGGGLPAVGSTFNGGKVLSIEKVQ
jgi:hypothetical protein